ncbi:MAG: non-homologous end-joining DNA ligase [Candidatus Babeliales bacterium]
MGSIKMGPYTIETSNEDKIFFPKSKITKGDLVEYYKKISKIMVNYTKKRPLTMVRYPNGIHAEGFYQKDTPDYFPDWIDRKKVAKKEEGSTNYVIANNRATLVYLANQGVITPHLWLSKVDKLEYPDMMIFDLDPPPPGKKFASVRKTALKLKQLLESIDLKPFVKTTGSKGLHVVVPLKPTEKFDKVRNLARKIAELLVHDNPKELTLEVRKNKRGEKVFIDTLRNAFAQTAVAPYGVRPKEKAPVATPISWDEVEDSSLTSQRYTIESVFNRLDKHGDPWKGMTRHARSIKGKIKQL